MSKDIKYSKLLKETFSSLNPVHWGKVGWNWLVGEYDNPTEDIKVLHWTLGGPYFDDYSNTEFSDEWRKEFESMTFCKQL